MEDMRLNNKIYHHWRVVFEDNYGGLGNQKAIIHAKRWDIYLNKKEALIRGGDSMVVSGSDGKEVIWVVIYDHVLEEGNEHDEIVLQGFNINLFHEYKEVMVREVLS